MYRQIRAFWEVLSQESVGIFICAALPRRMWVAQEDVDVGSQVECLVPGHLCSTVPGQRTIQLLWQRA